MQYAPSRTLVCWLEVTWSSTLNPVTLRPFIGCPEASKAHQACKHWQYSVMIRVLPLEKPVCINYGHQIGIPPCFAECNRWAKVIIFPCILPWPPTPCIEVLMISIISRIKCSLPAFSSESDRGTACLPKFCLLYFNILYFHLLQDFLYKWCMCHAQRVV